MGVLLLWSSVPSEYFDLLTVALELSHLQPSLFVLLVLSLAHMVCLQQLSYLPELVPSLLALLRVSTPAFCGTLRTFPTGYLQLASVHVLAY